MNAAAAVIFSRSRSMSNVLMDVVKKSVKIVCRYWVKRQISRNLRSGTLMHLVVSAYCTTLIQYIIRANPIYLDQNSSPFFYLYTSLNRLVLHSYLIGTIENITPLSKMTQGQPSPRSFSTFHAREGARKQRQEIGWNWEEGRHLISLSDHQV